MTNNENGFLPASYEVPKGNENYAKLQKGENRFRILSKPILGWIDWHDKKPLRFPMDKKPSRPVDPTKPIKHFWAMVVWNVGEEKIQILEITQSTIQGAIRNLASDKDWGNPFGYDIKIIKTGDGMETEYAINPVPHKAVSEDVKAAYKAKGKITLAKLFDGGDPFENSESSPAVSNGKVQPNKDAERGKPYNVADKPSQFDRVVDPEVAAEEDSDIPF